MYQAARLSLGALGIITAITFRCVPAYNLHERVWFEGPDSSLDLLHERVEATRHYEFFWYPFRDLFEHKALALTNVPTDPLPDRKRERIDHSHKIFPSVRDHRFNEMEYALPAECGPACFADIRALIHDRHPELQWPIEYRTVAGDDVWLSPDYGRATVTISVHEDAAKPFAPLFKDCEAVFRAYGGRPHWGKIHTATGGRARAALRALGSLLAAARRARSRRSLLEPTPTRDRYRFTEHLRGRRPAPGGPLVLRRGAEAAVERRAQVRSSRARPTRRDRSCECAARRAARARGRSDGTRVARTGPRARCRDVPSHVENVRNQIAKPATRPSGASAIERTRDRVGAEDMRRELVGVEDDRVGLTLVRGELAHHREDLGEVVAASRPEPSSARR